MQPKYSFRFVCQGGGLDIKSAVLAASLKQYLRCSYEIIACIPQGEHVAPPQPRILNFFYSLGIKCQPIANPLAEDYLIGHKLACLAVATNCSWKVFLDSDIVCLKNIDSFHVDENVDVFAKLEDMDHHSNDEWQTLYTKLELGPPDKKYRSTVLNQAMPLYFNCGVLAIKNVVNNFAEDWIALARKIDLFDNLPRKRPNLDQMSFATLIIKNKIKHALLTEAFNFPGELRTIDPINKPYICHYHNPIYLLADEGIANVVFSLCEEYGELKNILEKSDFWVWKQLAK
ncbi:hypothetical protein [Algibacillus agarilyticus]|uniref:hypothetical protein n=1 Tax=Algibacillus agarilyticus TaxID=2234133 RepID=UPI000DCFF9E6|nr:hypothetical protein [Algibacillus agarilyticus]